MPTSPQPLPFDAAMRALLSQGLFLRGHGTWNKESADGIVATGLRVTGIGRIDETSYPIQEDARDVDSNLEHIRTLCEHWPYQDAKYIAIIGVEIPHEPPVAPHNWSNAGARVSNWDRALLQPFEGPAPDPPAIYQVTGVVPSRFVAGYVIAEGDKLTFIPNTEFDPAWDPRLLETTVAREHYDRRLDVEGLSDLPGWGAGPALSAPEHTDGPDRSIEAVFDAAMQARESRSSDDFGIII